MSECVQTEWSTVYLALCLIFLLFLLSLNNRTWIRPSFIDYQFLISLSWKQHAGEWLIIISHYHKLDSETKFPRPSLNTTESGHMHQKNEHMASDHVGS